VSASIIAIDDLRRLASPPPVVVIIDVLRAFTTAAVALARGASGAILASDREQVLQARSRYPRAIAVKDGPPDPDFDGVNSPVLLDGSDVAGRMVVLVTANGTRGALAAQGARVLVCASYVVAGATARYLREVGGDVTFVATGDHGRAEEDVSCAEYIDALMGGMNPDPQPYLRRAGRSTAAAEINQGVSLGYLGVHRGDVAACLELDRFPFAMVPTAHGDDLMLQPVRS
jgi:2-phosphosulfolactate phosphatase